MFSFHFQTPQIRDLPDQWATFRPEEQGLLFHTKPCSFGTTQTIPSCLVKYPPHAVTLLSLTNLGPVKRLDCGEGQMQHTPAPETAFHFQGRLHHGLHEVICVE